MRRFLKKKLKGSFTVEAAVIIPITFIIMLAAGYYSLYVRDVVTIRGIIAKTIYSTAFSEADTKAVIEEKLSKKLMLIKDVSLTYEDAAGGREAVVIYKLKPMGGLLGKAFTSAMGEKKVSVSAPDLMGRDNLVQNRITREIIEKKD